MKKKMMMKKKMGGKVMGGNRKMDMKEMGYKKGGMVASYVPPGHKASTSPKELRSSGLPGSKKKK